MSNKICSNCGTENEEIYKFCKNCGKEFAAAGGEQGQHNDQYAYNSMNNNNDMNMPEIDGIPAEEMSAFIGAKSRKILPKFAKMQLSGSKASFCWPVVIWSYLFGPVGAALWFLYRKMYKIAILFFAIGIIISGISTVANTYLSDGETATVDDVLTIYEEYMNGDIDINEYFDKIYSLEFSGAASVSNIVNIATAIITGIFAYYWYKKFAVKKINKVRSSNIDSRYYLFALSASGGTNGGAVVLGIVIYLVITSLFSGAAAILATI